VYRAEEFLALARIEITGGKRRIVATLNVVDDPGILGPSELGLSLLAFRQLGLPEGDSVEIAQAALPASLDHVRAKIDGAELSPEGYRAIAEDLAAHRYSKMEIAAFLIASARFTTAPEVLSMTRAMAAVGGRLGWNGGMVVDKHCIGGVPTGAPIDKGAGVDFFRKIGQSVDKGEPLYRIHAAFEADFRFAASVAAEGDGCAIASRA
jgi:thymidine phosphorylase